MLCSFQVGLPNVGKSTLFNTLTKLAIPAENFPFCTIEPNEARVNIPDERFEWLCQLFKPKSEVSTSIAHSIFLTLLICELYGVIRVFDCFVSIFRCQLSWRSMISLDWLKVLMKDKGWATTSYPISELLMAFFMFYVRFCALCICNIDYFFFGEIFVSNCQITICDVGAFEDPDIIHVDDSVDPVRDLEVISAELRLKVFSCRIHADTQCCLLG